MTTRPTRERPPWLTAAALTVAVLAVSTSAPLIAFAASWLVKGEEPLARARRLIPSVSGP